MDMFISFPLNEIIGQQSDPENIRDESFFGCRAEPPYSSRGGAETLLMPFIRSRSVRSSEETRRFFNIHVINELLL